MAVGESPPLGEDPLISQLVADRYRVIRRLGEGGMGAVYLAEHVVIEKKIALKVLAIELARRQDLVARFLQEARSGLAHRARKRHRHLRFRPVREGYVYIAMGVPGRPGPGPGGAAEGALAWSRVRDILVQICRALRRRTTRASSTAT